MNANSELYRKAIQFISTRIGHYTQPESLVGWCSLAILEVNYPYTPRALGRVLSTKLDKIEDLQGFTLMEKVRLVFLFSRPVSEEFVEELKDAKCVVKLNDERRMTYFSSPDGDCVLQSEQKGNPKYRNFKGKPANYKKKTVVNPARRSSRNVRNPPPPSVSPIIPNPEEVDDVEMKNEEEEEAPGAAPNDNLNIRNQDDQARTLENNQVQNSAQNNRNRVKMEDFLEEIRQEPEAWIPEEKAEMQPLESISLLKLVEQIETLAYINFDQNFQQKVMRAVRLFKANDQNIPIQEFNHLFSGILTSLKRERTSNPTRNSMQLIRLFKHLQINLIRPLGADLMADALKILKEEIEKLEGSEDEIPLKAVQTKIDGLMHFITNSWADLDG